ncbi:MAG: S8 family serine peptidase [Cyanobacteria bacterium RI_101]|nr:S8 family serine peptidase [Cyanobacteria bacterium RI_101]
MKRLLILGLFLVGLWFALAHFANSRGLASQGTFESIIVNFKNNLPTETLSAQMGSLPEAKGLDFNSVFSVDEYLYTLPGNRELLKQLRRSPLAQFVEYIEPNYIYQALEIPNDPDYSKQWNLRAIGAEAAWDLSKGDGAAVAVIDTGVSRVPDLGETEFVEGYNFVEDNRDTRDDNGHGTHVAGTIAQTTNNNYGVAGVAYKAKIMPLKVLSATGGGTVADIAEAIRYAADQGATVINLSLGGAGESQTLQSAIDYAYDKGVVIVAAAGNENRNSSAYPARYPKVISVAATDATGNRANYSNYGAGVDIAAPGGSEQGENGKILQETLDPVSQKPVLVGFQGTSMAAPHVAGTVALIQSAQLQGAKPGAKLQDVSSPQEVLEILKTSARKVSDDTFNHYGAGQLSAGEAVKLARQGQVTFRDFFRWLRDNGYLNPIFWFDGGAVSLIPKLLMVAGSYLLAILLRIYLPLRWTSPFHWGLILGSSGLFFLQGIYVFDLPQWPFRLLGSSLPTVTNALWGGAQLNPLLASAVIPFGLLVLLLGIPQAKTWVLGLSLGMASFLTVAAIYFPSLMFIGAGTWAQVYLGVNALLCVALVWLASQGDSRLA